MVRVDVESPAGACDLQMTGTVEGQEQQMCWSLRRETISTRGKV